MKLNDIPRSDVDNKLYFEYKEVNIYLNHLP